MKSTQIIMSKVNRNDVCPCGSGKKYKKCCALKEAQKKQKRGLGLKGLGVNTKKAVTPMSSLATKVFSVLSSTMGSSQSSLSSRSVKTQQEGDSHVHGDSCGCHHAPEEEKSEERGYKTLEELIGIDSEPKTDTSCNI